MNALARTLPTRDLFYISSEIHLRTDPYPQMGPPTGTNDFVAQEEDHHDHVSTNLFWARRGPELARLWEKVLQLERDGAGVELSRMNKLLGSSHLRRSKLDGGVTRRKEFRSPQGLRVHALDPDKFYNLRYDQDGDAVGKASAVSLQTTCAGDYATQTYVAKSLGFWGDVNGYYSLPPQTITINHLGGTKADVIQLFKILLAAGHYAQRAVEPPAVAVMRDLPPQRSQSMSIHSTFPLGQIEQGLSVRILEPSYSTEHAPAFLLGVGVDEDRGPSRALDAGSSADRRRRHLKAVQLLEQPLTLDMRQTPTFASLVRRLLAPEFRAAQAVVLHNFDWPGPGKTFYEWREWELPAPVGRVVPCGRLGERRACGAVCPGERGEWEAEAEDWPIWEELGRRG